MTTEIRQIGLVGTGLVGAAWAAFYAGKGLRVRLYDSDPAAAESGHAKAIEYLEFLRDHELLSPDQFESAGPRIQVADDLAHAVEGAQLVHESVSERYDVKKAVFKEIEAMAWQEAIIASSTSGLLISEIQKGLVHPERALIAHPFNPVHLVPLVELVPGELTRSGLAEEVKRGGYTVSDSDALRLAGFAWMATELERLRETIEDEAAMVRVQGALRG